jgi:hypothetical protein
MRPCSTSQSKLSLFPDEFLISLISYLALLFPRLEMCKTAKRRIKMLIARPLFICFSVLLTACGGLKPKDVAEPSQLTIDNAMASIGRGFFKMHQELGGQDTRADPHKNILAPAEQEAQRLKLGLWPCKVTATLNVTAGATESRDLVLDLNVKAPVEVVNASLSGKADLKNASSGSRGNVITIEMYSAACLQEKTLGYDKPEKVKDVVEGLRKGKDNAPMRVQ